MGSKGVLVLLWGCYMKGLRKMKMDRTWYLVYEPLNEIMDSVTVKASERMNQHQHNRIQEMFGKAEKSESFKVYQE